MEISEKALLITLYKWQRLKQHVIVFILYVIFEVMIIQLKLLWGKNNSTNLFSTVC